MSPFKLYSLYDIHLEFRSNEYGIQSYEPNNKLPKKAGDIDDALGGL